MYIQIEYAAKGRPWWPVMCLYNCPSVDYIFKRGVVSSYCTGVGVFSYYIIINTMSDVFQLLYLANKNLQIIHQTIAIQTYLMKLNIFKCIPRVHISVSLGVLRPKIYMKYMTIRVT